MAIKKLATIVSKLECQYLISFYALRASEIIINKFAVSRESLFQL